MKKWFLSLLCLLLLSGCGNSTQPLAETEKIYTYRENTLVVRPSDVNGYFTLLTMDEEYFYYSVTDVTETEEAYEEIVSFYRHALKKDTSPELILSLDTPIFRDFCVTGEHACFLLGKAWEEGIYHVLQEYDMKGNLISELSLKEILKERPDRVVYLSDGSFGILTPGYFVIMDKKGESTLSVTCPGEEFRGVLELSDGRIGLTYKEKGNQNVSFVKLNRENKAFSKAVAISGDGQKLLWDEKGLVYTDSKGINLLSEQDGNTKTMVDFTGRNMKSEQLVCVQGSHDEYKVLGYSTDRYGAKYARYVLQEQDANLTETDKYIYDDYGRRYIYLYDVSGELPEGLGNPVDAFNEQSDTYQVVVKDYHFDPDSDDTYDAAKMVALGEYPDLIFSSYNALIENLLNKNCLEDLTPYVENSKSLSMEELSPVVRREYTKQGILFALPDCYNIEVIYGDKEYLGEGGWTVSEFLDWLAQNPDAGGVIAMRRQIYDACIDSMLMQFIDWDKKEVSFDEKKFHEILGKLKGTNRKDSYSYEEAVAMYENHKGNLYNSINNPGSIAAFENSEDMEVSVKGYPGNGSEPIVYLTGPAMSIMANSENKEGAYAFLEFYLSYTGETMIDKTKERGFSRFYTINSYMEQTLQDILLAENFLDTPCTFSQEQLNKALNILPYARLRDYSKDDLKEMIWEEIVLYLDGQRDVEATCKVIQSRVQLYVNER